VWTFLDQTVYWTEANDIWTIVSAEYLGLVPLLPDGGISVMQECAWNALVPANILEVHL
jgi:hypothetical protein